VRYLLDTDHVSRLLYDHQNIIVNAKRYLPAVSIITVQELFNGWVSRANDPKLVDRLPEVYSKLTTTVKYLQTVEIVDFTPDADRVLKQLLKDYPELRKNRVQKDMRIAAIALSIGATVVTCNRRDFEQVPGLTIVDWMDDRPLRD
jgi:tRNA(fMet)-specific endonuclease VapC